MEMAAEELKYMIEQYLEGLIHLNELTPALEALLGLPPTFQWTPQVIDAVHATLAFATKRA